MVENTIKKRNDRSIELICIAMFNLMKEKEFEKISITELCDRAELARKTFYRNFKSKDDVIKISIDRLVTKFSNTINWECGIDGDELALSYFKFWYSEKEFLTLIFKNNLFNILNSQYDNYMKVFRRMIKGEEEMSTELEYFIIFISGGYWNMLQHWVRKDFVDTPEELVKVWSKLMGKIKLENLKSDLENVKIK